MFQFQGYRILSAPLLAALLMMAVGALAMMNVQQDLWVCLLYTSPSPRDQRGSRMPSSA